MNYLRDLLSRLLSSRLIVSSPIALALASILVLAGCSGAADSDMPREAAVQRAAVASQMPADACNDHGDHGEFEPVSNRNYTIQQGDQLSVNFYLDPEFNEDVTVEPDGNIPLKGAARVRAAGMTPAQLDKEIAQSYSSELRDPEPSVEVKNMPARMIYVSGQVSHPGSFPLQHGMTAMQAIADAGGFTEDAADDSVVIIRRDGCGAEAGQKVNLAKATNHPGQGEDLALAPYDIVVVPRSTIANVDLFVKHYIRDMLPVQPYATMPVP
jgi:protein involved in polysaccharide export with SLBB domain